MSAKSRVEFDPDSHAGATTSVYVGQPMDTIKTKLQTFPDRYQNFYDCTKKIFRQDGFRGLYAGSVPALVANAAGLRATSLALLLMKMEMSRKRSALHGLRPMPERCLSITKQD